MSNDNPSASATETPSNQPLQDTEPAVGDILKELVAQWNHHRNIGTKKMPQWMTAKVILQAVQTDHQQMLAMKNEVTSLQKELTQTQTRLKACIESGKISVVDATELTGQQLKTA